jgi:hypothetical protein
VHAWCQWWGLFPLLHALTQGTGAPLACTQGHGHPATPKRIPVRRASSLCVLLCRRTRRRCHRVWGGTVARRTGAAGTAGLLPAHGTHDKGGHRRIHIPAHRTCALGQTRGSICLRLSCTRRTDRSGSGTGLDWTGPRCDRYVGQPACVSHARSALDRIRCAPTVLSFSVPLLPLPLPVRMTCARGCTDQDGACGDDSGKDRGTSAHRTVADCAGYGWTSAAGIIICCVGR